MREDRELIRGLGRGNPAALRRIYEKYKGDLMTVATCFVADVGAAEDVLHDVFVSFAANGAGPRVRRDLKAYLTTCVANRARDHLRGGARRNRLCPASLDEVGERASAAAGPATRVGDREQAEAVCRALTELPEEQREVIVLHLHGPMTFRQIARQQGVSINTVKSRYRYGIDKMRSLLDEGDEE